MRISNILQVYSSVLFEQIVLGLFADRPSLAFEGIRLFSQFNGNNDPFVGNRRFSSFLGMNMDIEKSFKFFTTFV